MLHTYSLANPVLLDAVATTKNFLSGAQITAMGNGCRTDEKQYFIDKFISLAEVIKSMPTILEQDDASHDAVAYLHYFVAGSDWYITEVGMYGGVFQSFGLAILNGNLADAKLGYISIQELLNAGTELDLCFIPSTINALLAKKQEGV